MKILIRIFIIFLFTSCNNINVKDYSKYINNFGNHDYIIIVDFSIHSGKNRFFLFDKNKNLILKSLCEHGYGGKSTKVKPYFSNKIKSNCSSLGRFEVGSYNIMKNHIPSYLLKGLDSCNNNARKRQLLIHPYYSVPDFEIYPKYLSMTSSQGCFVISPFKFIRLSKIISNKKVILYSIY